MFELEGYLARMCENDRYIYGYGYMDEKSTFDNDDGVFDLVYSVLVLTKICNNNYCIKLFLFVLYFAVHARIFQHVC